MFTYENTALGVLALPGAKEFASNVVTHLECEAARRFSVKSKMIASAYGLDVKDVIRESNLKADFSGSFTRLGGPVNEMRPPVFTVRGRFTRFANGEIKSELLDSVRDRDVYVVQDVYSEAPAEYYGTDQANYSVNDHFMTLLTAVDAVMGASPARVSCVLPAYPYARQHKKKGREGLTAALVGRILEDMGVGRIITLDVHSKDIDLTFRKLHLDNLHASYQILKGLAPLIDVRNEDLVVLAPDTGAVDRNKYYANSLSRSLALLYKERDYGKVTTNANTNNIKSMRLLGDVAGKTVFLADDMLGTGGTLISALNVMKEMGAKRVIVGISLPLFTGDAMERLERAYHDGLFERVITTNAVTHKTSIFDKEWIIRADVSKLFAQAIARLHDGRSLSPLLDSNDVIQALLSRDDPKDDDD